MFIIGVVAVATVVLMTRRRGRRRKRHDGVYDATVAAQQGSEFRMAMHRRSPRTGRVDW